MEEEEWLPVFSGDRVNILQTMLQDAPRDILIQMYNFPYTPLFLAVMCDSIACLTWLLSNGFDNVNATSHNDITALMCAVVHGSKRAVPLLITHGAHANANGVSALHRALLRSSFDIARLLIDAGVPYNGAMCGIKADIMLVKRRRWNQRAIALRNALYASRQRITRDLRTTILRAFYALRWE